MDCFSILNQAALIQPLPGQTIDLILPNIGKTVTFNIRKGNGVDKNYTKPSASTYYETLVMNLSSGSQYIVSKYLLYSSAFTAVKYSGTGYARYSGKQFSVSLGVNSGWTTISRSSQVFSGEPSSATDVAGSVGVGGTVTVSTDGNVYITYSYTTSNEAGDGWLFRNNYYNSFPSSVSVTISSPQFPIQVEI